MAAVEQFNLVRHTWEVSDDVVVYLTVQSRQPLLPDAYSAIAHVVVAGDHLAATLRGSTDELEGSAVAAGLGQP